MAVATADIERRARARIGFPGVFAHAAFLGYLLAAIAVSVGWLVTRRMELVDAGEGLGYYIGIAGASMMGILLLYPVRKRLRFMRYLGATRHWFRIHMIFGVLGPILILYHCNFTLGSVNSNVALVCTLLVAVSGLIGRYLYAKIHVDLDGHKINLTALKSQARLSIEDTGGRVVLVPHLLELMTEFDHVVLEPPRNFVAHLLLPLKLAFLSRWLTLRLFWFAHRELKSAARDSRTIANERRRLFRAARRFISDHQCRVRRVALLSSYERLFSLWHVLHLPFFYMLVLTAILHVVAVHMY